MDIMGVNCERIFSDIIRELPVSNKANGEDDDVFLFTATDRRRSQTMDEC